MKKALIFSSFLLLGINLHAQDRVSILSSNTVHLNGGARATVNGASRSYVPFEVPANSTQISYHISTNGGAVDCLLLPNASFINPFINKEDNRLQVVTNGSRNNFHAGDITFSIPKSFTKQTYYLGLRNPASFTSVDVTVEATAVVE